MMVMIVTKTRMMIMMTTGDEDGNVMMRKTRKGRSRFMSRVGIRILA